MGSLGIGVFGMSGFYHGHVSCGVLISWGPPVAHVPGVVVSPRCPSAPRSPVPRTPACPVPKIFLCPCPHCVPVPPGWWCPQHLHASQVAPSPPHPCAPEVLSPRYPCGPVPSTPVCPIPTCPVPMWPCPHTAPPPCHPCAPQDPVPVMPRATPRVPIPTDALRARPRPRTDAVTPQKPMHFLYAACPRPAQLNPVTGSEKTSLNTTAV